MFLQYHVVFPRIIDNKMQIVQHTLGFVKKLMDYSSAKSELISFMSHLALLMQVKYIDSDFKR